MNDVREVIAEAIPCNIVYGRPQAADDIMRALTSAGICILGPDEVDAVVEACEEAMPYVSRCESDNFSNAALDTVIKLDTAIRALKEKRT